MVELTSIVAATLSNGIGLNGGLPWRLPGEMKYFARGENVAEGSRNAVIMGRKTWDGIPAKFRPLKGRANLVVSRAGVDVTSSTDTTAHASLEAALAALPPPPATHRAFLVGGAQLYNAAIGTLSTRVLLTRVLGEFECDTFLRDFTAEPGWARAGHDELCAWVGWDVPAACEEKGVKYRYEMWVKR